jgi:hypothetical protein
MTTISGEERTGDGPPREAADSTVRLSPTGETLIALYAL